jgi:hypothetical protein
VDVTAQEIPIQVEHVRNANHVKSENMRVIHAMGLRQQTLCANHAMIVPKVNIFRHHVLSKTLIRQEEHAEYVIIIVVSILSVPKSVTVFYLLSVHVINVTD